MELLKNVTPSSGGGGGGWGLGVGSIYCMSIFPYKLFCQCSVVINSFDMDAETLLSKLLNRESAGIFISC